MSSRTIKDICADRASYIFAENDCSAKNQQNYETLMCLGNGYLGVRSSFSEDCGNQLRLTLVAGLYDQQPNESKELFPLPDTTNLSLSVDGIGISPLGDGASDYSRELNLKNGLLSYSYNYKDAKSDNTVSVTQRRFVSMKELHLIAYETVVKTEKDAEIAISSSVNAKQTIGGTQHMFEEERIVLDGDLLWYGGRAACEGTQLRVASKMKIFISGKELNGIQRYATARRSVSSSAKVALSAGEELRIVRYALYYNANDPEWAGKNADLMKVFMQREMAFISSKNFDTLLSESEAEWANHWDRCDIAIASNDIKETLKTRLGIYHSLIMCPMHDDRVSIAAKGLTGPGYAGHVFWDCELFNLPFFAYTNPEAARKLCTYRYHTLDGARRKAYNYGFKGAMYPWESSCAKGDEQCPETGNYNADNSLRQINCGKIEHHVVCDIAYGLYNYVNITGDRDFFNGKCLEILFETANFWQSRLDYNEKLDRYEILDVIGPDEYKDHVNNNAFTNYMAAWNMKTALEEAEKLQANAPEVFAEFDRSIALSEIISDIRAKLPKLYLPEVNEDGLVPQDDTYLTLEEIDIPKYKYSGINRLIYRDYSIPQISKIMVSKQADVIQLMTLMPDLFSSETIKKNFEFYESKCLHDSSLSLSAYALVAAKLIDVDMALDFFHGAQNTDFGEGIINSSAGIHAANCGGIWQVAVFGFAGVKANGEMLNVDPVLPTAWDGLAVNLFWHGSAIKLLIGKDTVTASVTNGVPVTLCIGGKEVVVDDNLTVAYK